MSHGDDIGECSALPPTDVLAMGQGDIFDITKESSSQAIGKVSCDKDDVVMLKFNTIVDGYTPPFSFLAFYRDFSKERICKITGRLHVGTPSMERETYTVTHDVEMPKILADDLIDLLQRNSTVECLTVSEAFFVNPRVYNTLEIKYDVDENEQLKAQYRKIDVIQAAGLKCVFVIRCRETSNVYVLKELSCAPGMHGVSNLTIEPSVLQQIHQHLPTPFPGVIKTPQSYCEHVRVSLVYEMMSMDLFTGIENFANKHRLEGVTEDMAIIWLAQLITSVGHLQSRRVIHRDLKPENVFLDHNGNCVIGDLELAATVPKSKLYSQPDGIVGTPLYIPPEVFTAPHKQSRSHLCKSDMWALGVIGYELLSNSNPWDVDIMSTPFSRLCNILVSSKPMKSRVMSDLYWDLIKKLLSPHVSARPSPSEALEHPLFDNVRSRLSVDKLFPRVDNDAHAELSGFVKESVKPNSLYVQHKAPIMSPVTPSRRLYGSPTNTVRTATGKVDTGAMIKIFDSPQPQGGDVGDESSISSDFMLDNACSGFMIDKATERLVEEGTLELPKLVIG